MTEGCWACADRVMHEGDVCDHCGAMADAHGGLWRPDSDDSDDSDDEPEAACASPR
jgi:rRNA maturation endonuclease Nob1